MPSTFLDIVLAYALFCMSAINLPIIVTLVQNTILLFFCYLYSHYCNCALIAYILAFCHDQHHFSPLSNLRNINNILVLCLSHISNTTSFFKPILDAPAFSTYIFQDSQSLFLIKLVNYLAIILIFFDYKKETVEQNIKIICYCTYFYSNLGSVQLVTVFFF